MYKTVSFESVLGNMFPAVKLSRVVSSVIQLSDIVDKQMPFSGIFRVYLG